MSLMKKLIKRIKIPPTKMKIDQNTVSKAIIQSRMVGKQVPTSASFCIPNRIGLRMLRRPWPRNVCRKDKTSLKMIITFLPGRRIWKCFANGYSSSSKNVSSVLSTQRTSKMLTGMYSNIFSCKLSSVKQRKLSRQQYYSFIQQRSTAR